MTYINYLIPPLITIVLALWSTPTFRDGILAKVAKLPQWAQPIPPIVLALASAFAQGWQSDVRGEALFEFTLQNGGQFGLVAIGIWHTWKRVSPLLKKTPPAALVLIFALPLSCQAVKTANSTIYDVCVAALKVEPIVQATAEKKAIPWAEYAGALCQINSVLYPFIQASNVAPGAKTAGPTPTQQALAIAREHGMLEP